MSWYLYLTLNYPPLEFPPLPVCILAEGNNCQTRSFTKFNQMTTLLTFHSKFDDEIIHPKMMLDLWWKIEGLLNFPLFDSFILIIMIHNIKLSVQTKEFVPNFRCIIGDKLGKLALHFFRFISFLDASFAYSYFQLVYTNNYSWVPNFWWVIFKPAVGR